MLLIFSTLIDDRSQGLSYIDEQILLDPKEFHDPKQNDPKTREV